MNEEMILNDIRTQLIRINENVMEIEEQTGLLNRRIANISTNIEQLISGDNIIIQQQNQQMQGLGLIAIILSLTVIFTFITRSLK